MEHNQTQSIGIKGAYSISTLNKTNNKVVTDKCFSVENTVTADGADYVISRSHIGPDGRIYDNGHLRIAFGTGTAAVAKSDIVLGGTVITSGETSLIRTVGTKDIVTAMTTTIEIKRRATFAPGTATGTFGQVGLYGGTTVLYAGQQIKDGNGNPVTVTFLDNEEVTVDYSLFVTLPCKDPVNYGPLDGPIVATATKTIAGTPTTVKFRGMAEFSYKSFSLAPGESAHNSNSSYVYGQTPTYSYTPNSGFHRIWMYHSDTIDGVYTLTSVSDSSNAKPILETIIKGESYKLRMSGPVTIPYTTLQNKFIKAAGALGSGVNEGNRKGNNMGIMEFDPPFFKGKGDEFTLDYYFTILVTT